MRRIVFALAFVTLFLGLSTAQAAIVTLNGEVHDNTGTLVSGSRTVTVRIYSTATGGTALWSEVHTSVTFVNGQFSIQVGSHTTGGVPNMYLDGYYVGVTVSGTGLGELGPRIQAIGNESTWTGFW